MWGFSIYIVAIFLLKKSLNFYWSAFVNEFKKGVFLWSRNQRAGLNDSHGFSISIYGTGNVKKFRPLEFRE